MPRSTFARASLLAAIALLTTPFPALAQQKPDAPPSQSEPPKHSLAAPEGTVAWRSVIEAARPAVVVIKTDKGQGSGFLIKSDGTIATNAHVIADASTIEVKLATGETYRRVYVLASDETEDVALLRIEAADAPTLKLGNSNDAKVGDDVVLVGAPLGLEETISTGIVSAIRILPDTGVRVIQTTAAASPGSSGGPLLDRNGEVLGLIAFSMVQGQSLNFAIPINYIRGKLDALVLSPAAHLFDSTHEDFPGGANSTSRKRTGVILAGIGGPGTPQGSFEFISVQLLDYLSEKGVDMMNQTASFNPMTNQVASLNYYLQRLPTSGASGLLYMTVERPRNFKYIVRLQSFDANGKLTWEEKESKDGWSETGAVNGVLEKIEKKLLTHIGSAGLPLKKGDSEKAPDQHSN